MTPATALLYHRLTSLEPGREDDPDPFVRGWVTSGDHPLLVGGFVPNVIADWPAACKPYQEGLPAVALPRDWPAPTAPATAVLAGRHPAPRAPLDLPALARVLHLSAGVVRVLEREDRPRLLFRAAGRALSLRAVRVREARERPGGRRVLVRPRRPCPARHRAGPPAARPPRSC